MKRHWVGGVWVLGVLLIAASQLGCGLADKDSQASDVQLVLNELLANGASDEADWIELKNIGDKAVDLSAFSLADSSDRWTLPAGTTIAPGGYLLVVADAPVEPPTDGALHANFKLSSGGESLSLFDAEAKLIDEVVFGAQDEGVSWGRIPDGAGPWQALSTPTPGAENIAPQTDGGLDGPSISEQGMPSSTLALNELLAKGSGTNPDWIELYNTGADELNLAGYTLGDGSTEWSLPAGTKLAAGAYLLIFADAPATRPSDGSLHASFKLGSGGETITLKDNEGGVLDSIIFGAQQEDISWGRLPDGSGAWQALDPTPGAANRAIAGDGGMQDGQSVDGGVPDGSLDGASPSVVMLNELLAKDAAGGSDWIELFNLSAQPVELAGFTLGDGVESWALPAGTTLPANGYLLVYADAPVTPPADGKLHANFKLGAGGETITLSNGGGQLLDSVTFGAQDESISWGRLPDGSGDWQRLAPTPGATNQALAPDAGVADAAPACKIDLATASAHLVVNEVLASDGLGGSDWVELKNNGTDCFDLGGYLLSDNAALPGKWAFPVGTEIAAGAYLVVLADDPLTPPADGKLHAAFKLSSLGEVVVLSGPLGHVVDAVTFPALSADQAYARLPDGTGQFSTTLTLTPGAANQP